MTERTRNMFRIELMLLMICWTTMSSVLGDLPPGTRRNTYLPPEPTKGYNYNTPSVPFPRPTPSFPPGPRPTPSFPPITTRPTNRPGPGPTTRPYPGPGPRPTPGYPTPTTRPTPGGGYPTPGPRPTPIFPDYPGQPSGNNGNRLPPDHPDHVHEPGMPFDFNYAVKEDAYGNDYSHNAISDGDVTRGEYRVQLPDGRTQIVRYTADWKHGFSAQVTYEGTPRLDLQRPPGSGGNFRGY